MSQVEEHLSTADFVAGGAPAARVRDEEPSQLLAQDFVKRSTRQVGPGPDRIRGRAASRGAGGGRARGASHEAAGRSLFRRAGPPGAAVGPRRQCQYRGPADRVKEVPYVLPAVAVGLNRDRRALTEQGKKVTLVRAAHVYPVTVQFRLLLTLAVLGASLCPAGTPSKQPVSDVYTRSIQELGGDYSQPAELSRDRIRISSISFSQRR